MDQKDWRCEWKNYKPIPIIIDFEGKPWADPVLNDPNFSPKWNEQDGEVNRKSHSGTYMISPEGFPLNPTGRTGVCMRGLLGRWGPNHAADPIVTRWKRNDNNEIVKHSSTGKPILQFVSIQRKDGHQWAIPGGMVDPGETVSETLKREFLEESLNFRRMTPEERDQINQKLTDFFSNGETVYKGYVKDPRNTDHAWIETVAVNFHDESGTLFNDIRLKAGHDARNVKWMDIEKSIKLYANHLHFIKKVVEKKLAHW